ncbi:MAG: glycosyltransferase family 4 protein [Candidatus Omnitrophica bacterium]|nr:glycosyltransferase family 4 protein [Candidatus Omnitrophota bacterium]
MVPTKKILFISHEASRTGAPIVLLHLLRWLKNNTNITFKVLLLRDGELVSEFKKIAPTIIFFKNIFPKSNLIQKKINNFARKVYLKYLKNKFKKDNIYLIYSNTIANGEVLKFLSDYNYPVICHVHELEYVINLYKKSFEQTKKYVSRYIALSEAVKKNLIENHNISEEKIEIVYGFIPMRFYNIESYSKSRNKICSELEIPLEAFIVCACGSVDWRKGPDLFIQLAYAVYRKKTRIPVYFLWIGGGETKYLFQLLYDAKKLGIDKFIYFLGAQQDPLDYFLICDVFVSTSREDPFPIVCLEAASLGKPILCFDKAGGAKEFVENDAGFVIPYLDIEAMADAIIKLLNSPQLCECLGQQAKRKAQERFNIEIGASKIFTIIERYLQ